MKGRGGSSAFAIDHLQFLHFLPYLLS
uniref:Uncharacterized protein n=1 Tax=Rhizophora mucronata TaxID=61149 RepID=A0A2P2MJV1_RHIMU